MKIRPTNGKGAGTQFFEEAVVALWSAGHNRATLTTDPKTRAFEFYKSQGWKHIGYVPPS